MALRGRDRDSYKLSVKFDRLRGAGPESGGQDGRPAPSAFMSHLGVGN